MTRTSKEEINKMSSEQIYEELFQNETNERRHQLCVEELQRRYLKEIGKQTNRLADSSGRVETISVSLETTVKNVGSQVQSLSESSTRMERFTKWLIGLTVALLSLTVIQIALFFFPKR